MLVDTVCVCDKINSTEICTEWFPNEVLTLEKKVGDYVAADEVVMEIETDKTAMPVHAPAAGVIAEILVNDGDTVKPGQHLFKLTVGEGAPPPAAAKPAAAAPAPKPAAAPAAPPVSPPPPPPSARFFQKNKVHNRRTTQQRYAVDPQ
uniref:Dihydrolipoyllysine-residue succinyltransferase component of 2-oxoglutarate dehydrogenase complex, mitochondrial-like n=1 Tax=Diabrotica virgifera virgifera TaxID=50390 RepID=A0A6P7GCS5_DIAVI